MESDQRPRSQIHSHFTIRSNCYCRASAIAALHWNRELRHATVATCSVRFVRRVRLRARDLCPDRTVDDTVVCSVFQSVVTVVIWRLAPPQIVYCLSGDLQHDAHPT